MMQRDVAQPESATAGAPQTGAAVRSDTAVAPEPADSTSQPGSRCLAHAIGGIWIPVCYGMAAKNVDENKCERADMVTWLWANVVASYVAPVWFSASAAASSAPAFR